MPDKNDVPLMFRAQIQNRCQLQYVKSGHLSKWKDEWIKAADIKGENAIPTFEYRENFESKEYNFSWRFVTNGGQDDGIIRPVIGAFGLPFYPGSSMKGAFCQACSEEQKKRYHLTKNSEEPSLLRFHGGYPVNDDWKKELIDIVHPQQQWQVKTQKTMKKPEGESAFGMVSLYRPVIKFTISSLNSEINWNEVWEIWKKALGYGIGCRVSSGYGFIDGKIDSEATLWRVKLHGQGVVSQLFNRESFEFRSNIFRAALRGHALRIFGGLNQAIADDVVDELFGGIRSGKEKVGLLGINFQLDEPEWSVPEIDGAYDVNGDLVLLLFGKLMEQPDHRNFLHKNEEEHRQKLAKFAKKLTQFAMLLGGFGKSWRRADHRIFYKKYTNHLIGCYWEWVGENYLDSVDSFTDATKLIKEVLTLAKDWLKIRGYVTDSSPIISPTKLLDLAPKLAPATNQRTNENLLSKPVRPTTTSINSNTEMVNSDPKLYISK